MTGVAALLFGWCSAAEFGEDRAYTLAEYGVTVKTTCADRSTNPETDKTYCSINRRAELEFLKDTKDDICRAEAVLAKLSGKP